MAVETELSHQYCYILLPCDRWKQRDSLTTVPDSWHVEVCLKWRSVIEFLHAKKIAPIDIHQHLVNIYRDWTVDMSSESFFSARKDLGLVSWGYQHVPESPAVSAMWFKGSLFFSTVAIFLLRCNTYFVRLSSQFYISANCNWPVYERG